ECLAGTLEEHLRHSLGNPDIYAVGTGNPDGKLMIDVFTPNMADMPAIRKAIETELGMKARGATYGKDAIRKPPHMTIHVRHDTPESIERDVKPRRVSRHPEPR